MFKKIRATGGEKKSGKHTFARFPLKTKAKD